jgi:hypothetical protein
VIGAGYGFLVLATMGLATLAFVLVLIRFLVVIAGTRVRLGTSAVVVAGGLGFVVGFLAGWAWLLVPLRLRCRPSVCELAVTALQGAVGGLIYLAVPFVPVACALAIRRSRMRA